MLNYMSDSVFERVSKIVELMDMNGNTKEYQEKAKRLDPEELAALRKLKARRPEATQSEETDRHHKNQHEPETHNS